MIDPAQGPRVAFGGKIIVIRGASEAETIKMDGGLNARLHKLSRATDDGSIAFSQPAVFEVQPMVGGERLVAGAPGGDSAVFARLAGEIAPPLYLLYILHTPRGEGEPGRYQSPRLGRAELNAFLERYSAFLAGDGRHDLWVYSIEDDATVVWERHNLVYATTGRNSTPTPRPFSHTSTGAARL